MPLVALWIPTALDGLTRRPGAVRVAPPDRPNDSGRAAEADALAQALPHALTAALLAHTPHVAVTACDDPGWGPAGVLAWADARGLAARPLARSALAAARGLAERALGPLGTAARDAVRVGIARVPVAAELTARGEALGALRSRAAIAGVAPGRERAFLAPLPLASLAAVSAWRPRATTPGARRAPNGSRPTGSPHEPAGRPAAGAAALASAAPAVSTADVRRAVIALADLGVETCGELAALDPDAVAVRLGAAGVALWRLARGDDARRLFAPPARDLPCASADWTEYELRDPAALAFVARRLVERVVGDARARGVAPSALVLRFTLGGGGAVEITARGARAAADAAAWWRLVRDALERARLDDGVSGLALRVAASAGGAEPQGDVFDRGFQHAAAAEAALARLVDDGDAVPVVPEVTRHPLPERRVRWAPATFDAAVAALRAAGTRAGTRAGVRAGAGARPNGSPAWRAVRPPAPRPGAPAAAALALRVAARPREVVVTTRAERGERVPVGFRERRARGLLLVGVLDAAGPDRVSTGHGVGAAHAREYWQCATDDGRLVLLFRDAAADGGGAWYLHGWWD